MQSCFAGKETEFNWQDREKSIFTIRGMIKGNVHQTYRGAFIASLKTAVDGILKAVGDMLLQTGEIATLILLHR